MVARFFCILTAVWAVFLPATAYPEAQPMTLQQAEQTAEENNFELRMLRAERKAASETENARFRDFFPSASVSYRQNRTVAQRDYDNGTYSVQVTLSQPIYDGGRTALAHEIAEIDVKMAGENFTVQRNRLRFQVRQGFLQLQQALDNITLARFNIKSAETMLSRAGIERSQGAITELDFRQIQNEHSRRLLEKRRQENQFKDAKIDFLFLLRMEPGSEVELSRLDLYSLAIDDLELDEETLYNAALLKRPDIRQARIDVEKARREHLITEYYYLPTVALTGRYGKTGDTWPPTTSEWGIGFNVTFNIFGSTLRTDAVDNRTRNETGRGLSQGGQLDIFNNPGYSAAALRNEIQLRRTRQKNEDLLFQMQNEVHRQMRDLREQKKDLELADEALAVREMRLELSRMKYRNGELSLQLLFDEEMKAMQARYQLVQQRVQSALAVGKLELGLGLELDELNLLHFSQLENNAQNEGRSWQPRTRIEIPRPGIEQEMEHSVPRQ